MSDIKAIVLDLDGTVLGSDKSISSRNYQTVDSGMRFVDVISC